MKLVSVNIENNLHTDRVLHFLEREQPDVVCFQELLEEDVARYEAALGYKVVYQPWYYITQSDRYPALVGKRHGVAVLARDFRASGSVFYTGKRENINKSYEEYAGNDALQHNHVFVWADVMGESGAVFRIVTTHLPVTVRGAVTDHQLKTIDTLLEALKDKGELVLCGDTNAPRGREAFGMIAEQYTDNIPMHYATSIDQHLHKVPGIQFMVDGLFTSPAYTASNVRLVDGVSDHMAVVAQIDRL